MAPSSYHTVSTGVPASIATAPEEQSHYNTALREKQLILSAAEELNWSGRGQHVEFEKGERVPLTALPSAIAKGATAIVDIVLCRRIKLARKSITCTRKLTHRVVLQEVQHLQQLEHAHIVQLVGTYLQGRTLAILLYPVADFNLESFLVYISDEERVENTRSSLFKYGGCLIHALAYIHKNTIKHLDIKPKNILVRRLLNERDEYRFYIADFGVSKAITGDSQTDSITARSPTYCSPEVFNLNAKGRSADVFSMGCVLLEMATVYLGRSLDEFAQFRAGGSDDESYRGNLGKVMEWTDQLDRSTSTAFTEDGTYGLEPWVIQKKLHTISEMLHVMPNYRPHAEKLKESFPANPNCCDRAPERYEEESRRLYAAARLGHSGIVQHLLAEGIEPNLLELKDDEDETATRLLIENGWDPKIDNTWEATLWHSAIRKGWIGTTQFFLEKGFEVDRADGNLWTGLHLAASRGDLSMVRLLLENKADSRRPDDIGDTALHKVVRRISGGVQRVQVVRLLLETADADQRNFRGQTALQIGVLLGHKDVVDVLLVKGAGTNSADDDGETALHKAIVSNRIDLVQLLLEKGADTEAKSKSGKNALLYAMEGGNMGMLKALFQSGVDLNTKTETGRLALHQASQGREGYPAPVEGSTLLAEKFFDTGIEGRDKDGMTALHLAAFHGMTLMAKALLVEGADIEGRDRSGRSALHAAVKGSQDGVVRLLLENGANARASSNDGNTALHLLHLLESQGIEIMLKTLLQHQADIEARNNQGETALHCAALHNRLYLLRLLLEHDANIEAKTTEGKTPLHYAAESCAARNRAGYQAAVHILVDRGANVHAKTRAQETPLHFAALRAHHSVIKFLLEEGADPNAESEARDTPLHWAVRRCRRRAVLVLLRSGADVMARTDRGETPLHCAVLAETRHSIPAIQLQQEPEQKELVQILLDGYGADITAENVSGKNALQLALEREFSPLQVDWESLIQLLVVRMDQAVSSGAETKGKRTATPPSERPGKYTPEGRSSTIPSDESRTISGQSSVRTKRSKRNSFYAALKAIAGLDRQKN